MRARRVTPVAVGALVALLVATCGIGGPVVNRRFVPITLGVVAASDSEVTADARHIAWFELADGRRIEVNIEELDPFRDLPGPGDLLLLGADPQWTLRAAGDLPPQETRCYAIGTGRAFDRGSTIEIELDRKQGWFLVVPKAPGYKDHGSDANGVLQLGNCLDAQGRALGPDYQPPPP